MQHGSGYCSTEQDSVGQFRAMQDGVGQYRKLLYGERRRIVLGFPSVPCIVHMADGRNI